MANHYASGHDLEQLSIGVPIHTLIKVKPNAGYYREDIKIHGDRVGLLDVNNRIREEYECPSIYDGGIPLHKVFEEEFPQYIRAVLEGINIGVVALGTTGSGKSFNIEGEEGDTGLLGHITKALFENLEEKRYRLNQGKAQSHGYNFSVKLRYVEVLDEELNDLLVQANIRAQGTLQIIHDEWEGPAVLNASWMPCASGHHLVDMFSLARRNRTQAVSDFGPLSERSASVITIEVLQVTQSPTSNEASALASRISLVDLPGFEKLHDDPETLQGREGPTLNKAIFSVGELINNLSQGNVDYVRYDASCLTQLLNDLLGGNCYTMALVCLQNGDLVGSSLVLNYMRQLRQINNYPVINDSRQLGLLRKFRKEIIHLTNVITSLGSGNLDSFSQQIAELERQLIEGNLEKLRFVDEKNSLTDKIREIKESYNAMAKEKAAFHDQLIKSEEERLMVAKQLIELQISHAELQEKQADSDFQVNTKLLHAENEILAANMKEEKALQSVHEMQDRVKNAEQEKRQIEIEFVSLKANYMNLRAELTEEKLKNENLSVEVINLVNANKALSGDTDALAKIKANLAQEREVMAADLDRLQRQNREREEALLNARSEIEQLRAELIKYDLNAQRQMVDYDNKKIELERGYLEITRKIDAESKQKMDDAKRSHQKVTKQHDMAQSDITALSQQLKLAQRKVADLEDDHAELTKMNSELSELCSQQKIQIDELRDNFRGRLIRSLNEGMIGDDILRDAREELFRNFNEKELELNEILSKEQARNKHSARVIRGLRKYARDLKYLAQDWAPPGQPLPDILTMPPPITLEDEDQNAGHKASIQELERLRLRNEQLENELRNVQQQAFGTPGQPNQRPPRTPNIIYQSRPGSSNYELDVIKKERNQLREENKKLVTEIREINERGPRGAAGTSNRTTEQLQAENQSLRNRLATLENTKFEIDYDLPSDNPKVLAAKLKYYQEVLKKLEKERSELSVRATMAEEQLSKLQEHMTSSTQNYQKKIAELQRALQGRS